MAIIGRFVATKTWVGLTVAPPGADVSALMAGCPLPVLLELANPDKKDTSFWVVDHDGVHVDRVIAAYFSTRESLGNIMIKRVDSDHLKDLSITVHQNPGNTVDHGVNGLHRDVPLRTCKEALELAYSLLNLPPIIKSIDQVTECILASLEAGYFSLADLKPKLLKDLADRKRLRHISISETAGTVTPSSSDGPSQSATPAQSPSPTPSS